MMEPHGAAVYASLKITNCLLVKCWLISSYISARYPPVNDHGCGNPSMNVDFFPRETMTFPHLCKSLPQGICQHVPSRKK
jgi:hypothetical protein